MYRMLIVDDEKLLLNGLYELFLEAEGHRLEVYKASTALEALRVMSEKRVDILLSDIKMPKMSGLELGDQVKQQWPECKLIFLTGFDQFDYVHHAIKQGAQNYILKAEGDDAIVEAVRKTIRDLDEEQKMDTLIKQARDIQKKHAEHHRLIYLSDLLEGLQSQEDITPQHLETMGIKLAIDRPFIMCVARLDLVNSSLRARERQLLFTALHTVCVRFLSAYSEFTDVVYNREYYVFFIQSRDHSSKADEQLITFINGSIELIQQTLEKSTGYTFSFALTERSIVWSDVVKQFTVLKAFLSRYYDAQKIIVRNNNFTGSENQDEEEVRGFIEVFHKKANALETYIESGRRDEVQFILSELASYAEWEAIDDMRYMEMYCAVALRILTSANKLGLDRDTTVASHMSKLLQPTSILIRKEGIKTLQHILNQFEHYHSSQSSSMRIDILWKINQYIETHLGGDLSVSNLAEQVYLNPDYLSRMFKQSKGITLTEYIAALRIQRAKELLTDPRNLVQDIAKALGFTSAGYFSRFFKKETGQTPQEFRTS
ncbi:two-component system response regulator YesN [Paenibacillus amylolyticus]|uniref:Two-component system response regulator YesN n=1 Tax=Paenibacillus amylolyticus TaxID=1451 RepID=A0AAP5H4A6_PAEAM|nr:response regulator [Paenibacillus amylolyticus]MDR6724498.1 two-component system response regulator YesN [Paenibacillus amylolyticus]